MSLFADSIDFLEDASINFLVLIALNWAPRRRAMVGVVLAGLLLVPAAATLWMIFVKFNAPIIPAPAPLSLAGAGALCVNLYCALLLARHRKHEGSMVKAAFYSARNDAFANAAIIVAAGITVFAPSIWPDLVVGVAIAALNIGAAQDVLRAARRE